MNIIDTHILSFSPCLSSPLSYSDSINLFVTLSYSYIEDTTVKMVEINVNDGQYFELDDVIEQLENNGVKFLENTGLSFYDKDMKYNVFFGVYPNISNTKISLQSVQEQKLGSSKFDYEMKINIRYIPNEDEKLRMEIGADQLGQTHLDENKTGKNENKNSKARRSKERKIAVIIEKVYMWRKLYSGFYDENNSFIKFTLEEAAEKVGISKKSLDDYLNQLKYGLLKGFNYNDNRNSKVGTLRSFLKCKKR